MPKKKDSDLFAALAALESDDNVQTPKEKSNKKPAKKTAKKSQATGQTKKNAKKQEEVNRKKTKNDLSKKQRRIISDERILTAALSEFAKKGYSKASFVDIADSAGVSVGLVAQNFGCKELLFEGVYKRNYQMLNLPYKGKNGNDWKERIYDIITRYSKDLQKESFFNEMKFICVALSGKDVPDTFVDFFESSFMSTELSVLMQKAQKKGEIVKGDIAKIYTFLYRTICSVLLASKELGVPSPDKEWFISIILKKKRK